MRRRVVFALASVVALSLGCDPVTSRYGSAASFGLSGRKLETRLEMPRSATEIIVTDDFDNTARFLAFTVTDKQELVEFADSLEPLEEPPLYCEPMHIKPAWLRPDWWTKEMALIPVGFAGLEWRRPVGSGERFFPYAIWGKRVYSFHCGHIPFSEPPRP